MNDIIGAIRDWLAAQASVSALVGTQLYVNRLPRDVIEAEDTFHPNKMIVVRQAGGFPKADRLQADTQTFNVICYGESDFEADSVRRAIWPLFVNLDRVTQGGVLIYHVNPAGGALPLVDPDIVWPAVSQNFTVMACTV